MAQKQIKDPPTPLRQFRAELPAWCQDILDRALAKAPDDRFQTAEEFRAALTRITVPIVNDNVGSTAALATAATGMSGMDLTVPPNVMITPVSGVNTGAVVGELPETVLSASPAKPLRAQVPAPAPPRKTTAGRTPLVLAALGIVVLAAVGVAVVRSRRAPVETSASTQVSATVDPAPSGTVAAPQTPPVETPPAPTPAPVTPQAASAMAATTKDTGQPSGATAGAKDSKAAAKPTVESQPVAPAAPSVDPAVPASSTTPATLPSVIFKPVDLLMFDAGKSKDREASLTVGDGALEVIDGRGSLAACPLRHHRRDLLFALARSAGGSILPVRWFPS